jgi:SET domain-containing protein
MTDVIVQPSGIEGLGLFAARSFFNGERIRNISVVREITSVDPIRPEAGERADHCDYPDGKVVLLGFPDRHVNHSCDPNAFVVYTGTVSAFVARRDISCGTEITIDYNVNISGGTAWPCHCGAFRCSGTVVGDFFLLPPERQLEYLPLLADWFIRRHRERVASLLPGGSAL